MELPLYSTRFHCDIAFTLLIKCSLHLLKVLCFIKLNKNSDFKDIALKGICTFYTCVKSLKHGSKQSSILFNDICNRIINVANIIWNISSFIQYSKSFSIFENKKMFRSSSTWLMFSLLTLALLFKNIVLTESISKLLVIFEV